MAEKQYLDDNGNPIAAPTQKQYLDPTTGEPIKTAAAPDTRNFIQRGFDALTTVTPEQKAGHGAIVNAAQEFGAHAIHGLGGAFVHPLDTLSGIGSSLAHPIDTAVALGKSAIDNPAGALGELVGGALLGEAGAPILKAASGPARSAVGRSLLLGRTPEAAYESALKIPPAAMSQAERAQAVQTALENRIPVSKGGLQTLGNRIDELDQARQAAIATDPTRPINTMPALKNLDSVRAKFANQVTPQADLAEINQVESDFLNNPKLQPRGAGPGPASLPAAEAQAMKSGTYRVLGGKAYGEVKGASIESQKGLARGLKDEIANQFPELKNINATESQMLDLYPVLERAVNRNANHQFFGLGTPAAGVAGEVLSGSPAVGRVAMVMKSVLDDPFVKSRLAIAVSKGGKIPLAQATARVAAYSSALGATASAAQASPDDQTASK